MLTSVLPVFDAAVGSASNMMAYPEIHLVKLFLIGEFLIGLQPTQA